jgi:serine/threonine protein kinase
VKCRYCVYFLGFCHIQDQLYLVFEYLCFGDLEDFLSSNTEKNLDDELPWFCIHIAKGMNFIITQHQLLHNDLAARNILVALNDRTGEGKYIAKISGMLFK